MPSSRRLVLALLPLDVVGESSSDPSSVDSPLNVRRWCRISGVPGTETGPSECRGVVAPLGVPGVVSEVIQRWGSRRIYVRTWLRAGSGRELPAYVDSALTTLRMVQIMSFLILLTVWVKTSFGSRFLRKGFFC